MQDGSTPLILAVKQNHKEVVEDLVNSQADLNAVDDTGQLKIMLFKRT